MRIVHVSRLCTMEMYNKTMKNNDVKDNQSILKFNRVMVEGFHNNGLETVVLSERPVNKNNCDYDYLPSEEEVKNGVKYHYIRIFNNRIVCTLYTIISSFLWLMIHANKKKDVVVLDTYQLALTIGTILACKIKRIICIGVVTDIPTKSVFQFDGNKVSYKSVFNDWLISIVDGLILLTKQMNDVINPNNKPYIVIEGFADLKMKSLPNSLNDKYQKWTVMYTGGVNQAYGLDILIEGFIDAAIPNSQLIIYGGGPYVETVIEYSHNYTNIIYGGILNNDEIVNVQMKANLLVNLRYTDHEFTKYSFPGKNIEYMASGTPTLTTDLPAEYKNHVFVLQEETKECVSRTLKDISDMPLDYLHSIGIDSREWILREKNNMAQCNRIINFINSNFAE